MFPKKIFLMNSQCPLLIEMWVKGLINGEHSNKDIIRIYKIKYPHLPDIGKDIINRLRKASVKKMRIPNARSYQQKCTEEDNQIIFK